MSYTYIRNETINILKIYFDFIQVYALDLVYILTNSILYYIVFTYAIGWNTITFFHYYCYHYLLYFHCSSYIVVSRSCIWIWLYVCYHYLFKFNILFIILFLNSFSTSLLYELVNFNLVLDNICLFIIPHLLGICLGHIIYKMNHNFNINIFFFAAGKLYLFVIYYFILY